MIGSSKGSFAIKRCLSLLLLFIGATVSAWCQSGSDITFTPTTVGWYRIMNGSQTSGGIVSIYNHWYDNTVTDIELQYDIGGYGVGGSIQQTRYSSYNGGVVSQARISSDNSTSVYLDIYISTAISPAPITLHFDGPNINGVVVNPVVGAVAGSTNLNTLTLGHGFNTTNNITAASVSFPNGATITPALAAILSSNNGYVNVAGDINIASGSSYLYNGFPIINAQPSLNNWYFGDGGNLAATGDNNISIGSPALASLDSGYNNNAVGTFALYTNTTGNNNNAFGKSAEQLTTSGYNNNGFGSEALSNVLTGNNNTAIGDFALYRTTGSQNIALGSSAGHYEMGSNAFYVNDVDQGSTSNEKAYSLLYGQFSGTAGSLGGQQLTVNGGFNVQGGTSVLGQHHRGRSSRSTVT